MSGSYSEARRLTLQLQASRMAACGRVPSSSNMPDVWSNGLTLIKPGNLRIGICRSLSQQVHVRKQDAESQAIELYVCTLPAFC